MLDYHGKQKHCMYLGVINGKMFEKQYDDMAKSDYAKQLDKENKK